MKALQKLTITLGIVLVLGLIGGVATYLAHTQKATRDGLRDDFANRTVLAGTGIGSALNASDLRNREYAKQVYAGAESELQATLEAEQVSPDDSSLLFRPDGSLIAAVPSTLVGVEGERMVKEVVKRAIETGRMAFGDIITDSHPPQATSAVPFEIEGGLRILAFNVEMEAITSFTEGYLAGVLDVKGARAYVVDSLGQTVITTSDQTLVGKPLPNSRLAAKIRAFSTGFVDGDYFATAPVSNSTWQVVFVAPDRALMDPVRSNERANWQLFGGFVVAMVFLVLLATLALSRSARLAHARLHDTLTGLPNRSLLLSRAERALGQRGRDDVVAAVFIDLDGFKPVNDVHGHAVGDALLVSVAERLNKAVRRGDVVSRFGGDEFLVLCAGMQHEDEVMTVADRILQVLTEPFEIEDLRLSIGGSIGVAVFNEDVSGPDGLIHNADLAMYQAKRGGKGRIVRFDPAMADS